jgi:Outer membrane protein beta-barrel domain
MKKYLLILFICQSAFSFSQKFGAKVGISYTTNIVTFVNLGVSYEHKLTDKLSLNTELNRSVRGYISEVQYVNPNGLSLGIGNEGIIQSYLELPVQLKLYLDKNHKFSVNPGIYFSYSLRRSIQVQKDANKSVNGLTSEELEKGFDGSILGASKVDYGVNLGLNYSLKKIPLSFDLRFYKGFTKQEQHKLFFLGNFQPNDPFANSNGNKGIADLQTISGLEFSIGYKF